MSSSSILGKISAQTKIYRIFSPRYFFELFDGKTNTLVLPRKWDDPFENILLRSKARSISDDEEVTFAFRDRVYGQCWTLEPVSDAMWQIYSPEENGIRVRTTVGKLIESIRTVHGDNANLSCFIGRVSYVTDKKLREFGKTTFADYVSSRKVAHSLLIKRKAYRFENEVRLIYFDHAYHESIREVYRYSFDPLFVIDQVMVDGRMSNEQSLALRQEIFERTGLSKRRIRHSLLYSEPKDFIVYVP